MQLGKLSGTRAGSVGGGRDRANSVALAALCLLLFLTFLDNTVVSVGLGSLQTDLQASISELQWVIGAYALTFAALMLACGMIGDELGRKKVMLAGAGVFCAGSVLCALAPNPQTLIAGRAVMGLGAAASEPGTLSIIRHIYTDTRERAWAIGIWAAVSGLALALGPVIGGAIVGAWSWRGIFWFNLVLGLAALIAAAITVPESSDPTAARVDTLGTVFGAGALAALMFAIIDAETASFGATEVIVLLCAAAVLAVAFVLREQRAAHPLLDLRFFRLPRFTVPNIVAFCTYLATFAIFFFTALYLVEVPSDSGYQIAAPHDLFCCADRHDQDRVRGGALQVLGIAELRDAIVHRHNVDFDSDYRREEVIASTGGKHALFNAIQVLVDHGDEVILPVPYWVSFKDIVRYAGGNCALLESDEARGFRVTAEMVASLITPRTKGGDCGRAVAAVQPRISRTAMMSTQNS